MAESEADPHENFYVVESKSGSYIVDLSEISPDGFLMDSVGLDVWEKSVKKACRRAGRVFKSEEALRAHVSELLRARSGR